MLYQGNTITLTHTGEGDGLLVTAEDLTRINGFELKPEGARPKQQVTRQTRAG